MQVWCLLAGAVCGGLWVVQELVPRCGLWWGAASGFVRVSVCPVDASLEDGDDGVNLSCIWADGVVPAPAALVLAGARDVEQAAVRGGQAEGVERLVRRGAG